jgi:hypothetical protein
LLQVLNLRDTASMLICRQEEGHSSTFWPPVI